MKISGHRTDSMFRRYAIVNEEQKREALAKTQQYLVNSGVRKVVANRKCAVVSGLLNASDRQETQRERIYFIVRTCVGPLADVQEKSACLPSPQPFFDFLTSTDESCRVGNFGGFRDTQTQEQSISLP
jgi:hypothetical protein